jgi:Tfp pilus assembly protein PilX
MPSICKIIEPLAKVFFCGSTSSPRTEKLNNFNLSPFTLSMSKGKLRTFAIAPLFYSEFYNSVFSVTSVANIRSFGFMKIKSQKENGFALIAALMAILILTAVGILVFTLSTQDIRISGRLVGEKKAFSAAEAGIHALTLILDPANLSASARSNVGGWSNDPDSLYAVGTPARPTSGPSSLPLAGYSIGGGQQWGQERFNARVTGTNTRYNSMVQVDVGVGYGPIEITTLYR